MGEKMDNTSVDKQAAEVAGDDGYGAEEAGRNTPYFG